MSTRMRVALLAWVPLGACVGRSDLDTGELPLAGCTEQRWQLTIAATEDDGEISREFAPGGTWFPDGETTYGSLIYVGAWAGRACEAYFRFAVPAELTADATVTAAHLSLWGARNDLILPDTRLLVGLEDVADASPVTGATDTPDDGNRTLLPTRVSWPPAGTVDLPTGTYNASPQLSPLLQAHLAHHGGWRAGHHLQLWLWAEDVTPDTQAAVDDFATPDAHPARLELTVCR